MVKLSVHTLLTGFVLSVQVASVFAAPATETLKLKHKQGGQGMFMPEGGYREECSYSR